MYFKYNLINCKGFYFVFMLSNIIGGFPPPSYLKIWQLQFRNTKVKVFWCIVSNNKGFINSRYLPIKSDKR